MTKNILPHTGKGFHFHPVGVIRSPFREKFAVPRQPGLAPAACGELELLGPCNRGELLRGLEDFSHLWITFVFHHTLDQGWKPTVRPPRLGGNRRLGVFATRSPFRPNPIGLSVVELLGIEKQGRQWRLLLGGIDMVDGTPVLDIKPYLPYADAVPEASGGFADGAPAAEMAVSFSAASAAMLADHRDSYPSLRELIRQVIAGQPQPAYHGNERGRLYAMRLYDFNIRWRVTADGCVVESIEQLQA